MTVAAINPNALFISSLHVPSGHRASAPQPEQASGHLAEKRKGQFVYREEPRVHSVGAGFFALGANNPAVASSATIDLMVRRPPSEGHKQLLRELNEERAAALQRISTTLESLIHQLCDSRERVRRATGPDREREIATWRDLRARAMKHRWYLEVQREALGMRRHDVLDEFYRVPTFD